MNGPGRGGIQPEAGETLLRRRSEQLLEHLDDGPVGDPLPVGETASLNHRGVVEPGEELVGQPRLPHARGTEHGEQLAGTVDLGLRQRGLQASQLTLSAEHRAGVPARRRLRANGDKTVRNDRGRLAFQVHGIHAVHDHCVADEHPRLGADQDLTRLRRLLEPRGHVHGVPGGEALLRACHDLARVDADPELERRPVFAQQILVQLAEAVTQLRRGAHAPQRIVLVENGDAEHRHHGIADELLHRPPVTFDDQSRCVEVARHHAPQRLGIESLAERSRSGHIAEQQGHRLALLARLPRSAQSAATGLTEASSLPILMAATRTTGHGRSLRRHPRRDGPGRLRPWYERGWPLEVAGDRGLRRRSPVRVDRRRTRARRPRPSPQARCADDARSDRWECTDSTTCTWSSSRALPEQCARGPATARTDGWRPGSTPRPRSREAPRGPAPTRAAGA